MKDFFRKNTETTSESETQDNDDTNLPVLYITETLLDETGKLLASFAEKRRSEGVVYWFGMELAENSVVTTLIVPDADTTWGCISTSPEVNAEALAVIIGTPLVLLGQAHSHPANHVRHSDVDNRQTFASFEGAISVVVPYFARRGINLRRCGIHRHINGAFRIISPKQIENHIVVIPGKADLRRSAELAAKK
jgi:hypothetical protein